MKKIKFLLALAPLAAVILTGCNTITEVGQINGVTVTTHTKRGFFSPSFCSTYTHTADKPGEIELRNTAANPGVLGEVAGAGGQVGAAPLFRPARSNVSVNSDNSSASGSASGSTSGNGNITIPPSQPNAPRQHPNSPGNGGIPGNGGVNNPHN